MKAEHRPLFDIDVLRERAGAKVFARGAAYHRDGQVEILAVKPGRVLAQVAYAEAAKLVARMATLRPKAEQVTYVLALKERFGRRRNFMKLLG
jgi:uncharacterized Zn finger protein